jgi:Tfp pilus assembly protein PilF
MRLRIGRIALGAAGLLWLAACATLSTPDNPFAKITDKTTDSPKLPAEGGKTADTTGSVDKPPDSPFAAPMLGDNPNDDLSIGKKYFRQGSYGLAERHFRKAVELHPRDAESWVDLAAAYDRLRRFDLADRAYDQAAKLIGVSPELMNNRGFSYLLRGDYRRARDTLLAAQARDPKNPYIANNLRLLAESERKAKQVN